MRWLCRHLRPLRERVLRTLPVSASIVTLARAIGKYQVQFAYCSFRHVGPPVLHWMATERGVTGVPTTGGSPTVSRRELGTLLRGLRIQKGWTAEQVAERLMVSPSKVSRLETGQRGASARDIRELCDLYEVDDDQRQHLMELAIEGKQRAWWQPLRVQYTRYVGLEAEATSISDYGLGIMPGLLQTPEFARAQALATMPRRGPDVVEQSVQVRIGRQQRLFSEHPPRFEAVVDESVLHRVVGSPAIMRAQLERLLELSSMPHVSLRVIPYDAGALPAANKFIILRFAQPTVPDVVFIEGMTGDLYLEEPDDVETYGTTFRALAQLAAEPETTREIIMTTIDSYRSD